MGSQGAAQPEMAPGGSQLSGALPLTVVFVPAAREAWGLTRELTMLPSTTRRYGRSGAKARRGSTDDCGFSTSRIDEKPDHGAPDCARDVTFQKIK